jgi:hypothetical protein
MNNDEDSSEPEQMNVEFQQLPELPEADVNVYEQEQEQQKDDYQIDVADVEENEKEEQFEVTIPDTPPQIPTSHTLPTSSSIQIDEDEDETNTSVTVIPIKNKTPSSSSSSISSAQNELIIDDSFKHAVSPLKEISPPLKPLETDFDAPSPIPIMSPPTVRSPAFVKTPPSTKSPPSKKSYSSSKKSPSLSSLSQKSHHSQHKSPMKIQHAKSPPRQLEFYFNERQMQADSDSIDSINAIDCKIDDDNRESESPTDSMPPAPTPPPLDPLTLLEKR